MRLLAPLLMFSLGATAHAEQYVIKTDFSISQPTQFLVVLNGQTLLLHRDADGNADITPWVKSGKNTMNINVKVGKNSSSYTKSLLTFGAGNDGKWRTLYTSEVTRDSTSRTDTFVFIGKPSAKSKPGKVSLFGKFSRQQPVSFKVAVNGETVSTLSSDGNVDVTPFLKSGKNVLTVQYVPGENTLSYLSSSLTIGQQVGTGWISLFKLGITKADTRSGVVSFPIYR